MCNCNKNHRRQDFNWHQDTVARRQSPIRTTARTAYDKRMKARRRREFWSNKVLPLVTFLTVCAVAVGFCWLAVRTF